MCMDVWMYMDGCGCIWICIDVYVYGCIWICIDVYGCVWMSMDVCETKERTC